MNKTNMLRRRFSSLTIALLMSVSSTGIASAQGSKVPTPPEFKTKDSKAYGRQIAEYLDQFDSGWVDEYTVAKLTLFTADGDSSERSIVRKMLEGKQLDKTLIRFTTPPEISGVAALTHERLDASDDNWLYLPATKRVRRISGANKTASFQGTEFTYEDLSNRVIAKYEWTYLGEETIKVGDTEVKTLRVQAKPRYSDTGYSRLILFVDPTKWRTEQTEYYDLSGRMLKTRNESEWKHVHNRYWRAMRTEMVNHQTGKRTVIKTQALLLNLSRYRDRKTGKARPNMTTDHFTTRSLEGR